MDKTSLQTPMMKQYDAAKKKLPPHCLLLFRLGDFFEFFHDDAIRVSKLLGITLTKRHGISMCGVPAHSADRYIRALLEHGEKLALCDQVGTVEKGSLVERDIVEILTPGSITDSAYLLSEKEHNYLFALYENKEALYASWMDVSIGTLYVYATSKSHESLQCLLGQVAPREIAVPESALHSPWCKALQASTSDVCVTVRPLWSFTAEEGRRLLRRFSESESVADRHINTITQSHEHTFCAVGGLLEYVQSTIPMFSFRIHTVSVYSYEKYLEIDANVIYHLELFSTIREHNTRHSLCGILDVCKTSMGSRMLKTSLRMPLRLKHEIERRCDGVQYFVKHKSMLLRVQEALGFIYDFERLLTRVCLNKAHPKDLYCIGQSLSHAHKIYTLLIEGVYHTSENTSKHTPEMDATPFSRVFADIDVSIMEESIDLLHRALREEPPTQFGEVPVIKEGYDAQLDELRRVKDNEDFILNSYVAKLSHDINVPLKLKSLNTTFGYCFEFSHGMRGKLPDIFVLRQTLKNVDRYKTNDLLDIEAKILHAHESLIAHEIAIFQTLCKSITNTAPTIHAISQAIAHVDMLASFAQIARDYNYTRPVFVDTHELSIERGRHAVVERTLTQGSFITNDIQLSLESESLCHKAQSGYKDETKTFVMLTGPNMAGKSTFLRQNALMVIMAHMGSFVPADAMVCGIFDKVFCRVGASDNLMKGESTFLTEMNETAFILNNATAKSLVIMDEIGRGTSVQDGSAIAQAVAEFFLHKNVFTLFATHYHDVARLDEPHMKACTIAALYKENDELVFTHKITDGIADNSYGIEVAKHSGLPRNVLSRAYEILRDNTTKAKYHAHNSNGDASGQEKIFNPTPPEIGNTVLEYKRYYKELHALLSARSIHSMTPLEAHVMLADVYKHVLSAEEF